MGLVYQSRNRFVVETKSRVEYVRFTGPGVSEVVWTPHSWYSDEQGAILAAKDIATEHEQVRVVTMDNN